MPHVATGFRPNGALTFPGAPFQSTWARSITEDASPDYNSSCYIIAQFQCWAYPSSLAITRVTEYWPVLANSSKGTAPLRAWEEKDAKLNSSSLLGKENIQGLVKAAGLKSSVTAPMVEPVTRFVQPEGKFSSGISSPILKPTKIWELIMSAIGISPLANWSQDYIANRASGSESQVPLGVRMEKVLEDGFRKGASSEDKKEHASRSSSSQSDMDDDKVSSPRGSTHMAMVPRRGWPQIVRPVMRAIWRNLVRARVPKQTWMMIKTFRTRCNCKLLQRPSVQRCGKPSPRLIVLSLTGVLFKNKDRVRLDLCWRWIVV
ncbi:hypothetical protein MA16_Dca002443 [Dendrobium catenatum]|uniref:Uncharacterized protein n=1 Tax=Dendrobium catenatum TaxID=906689 RepID=A0A2I0W0I0_9ASPA|nr:hypothetical protein MA16_Dca002443 [Dendrobium catenatum]